ncbi:MAG: histidine kinase [Candidatus Aminicenantes bacterium]|nr:histidine kinase [Candidatus Aminicenantes bacterium]
MHPFLRSLKNLVLMGLVWSPIAFSIVVLVSSLGGMSLSDSAVLTGPLMAVNLFFCLSTWYICRGALPDKKNLLSLILRHVLGAVLLNAIWLSLGFIYSRVLDSFAITPRWGERFDDLLPLLLAVGLFFYFISSLVHYLILVLEKNREAERMAMENRLLAQQAEMNVLKAFIHPHFLFNSLTALSVLTTKSPRAAREVCLRLSDFLRYSLTYGQQEWAAVRREWEHIEDYLEVEKIRIGERFQVEAHIDDKTLTEKIPSFTLFPLIENAVKHAFQKSMESGTLSVKIENRAQGIRIQVSNPLPGDEENTAGVGQGLKNLRSRLETAYSGEAGMTIKREGGFFKVELRLPRRKEKGK